MSLNLIILFMIGFFILGCGKQNKDESASSTISGQCRPEVSKLHSYLFEKAKQSPLKAHESLELNETCQELKANLGDQSCIKFNATTGERLSISYTQVEQYCSEVNRYVDQLSKPDRVPKYSTLNPRNEVNSISVNELNRQFIVRFEKSELEKSDLIKKSHRANCQFYLSSSQSSRLVSRSTILAGTTLQEGRNYVHEIVALKDFNRELFTLVCTTIGPRLLVKEVNSILKGLAEIQKRPPQR